MDYCLTKDSRVASADSYFTTTLAEAGMQNKTLEEEPSNKVCQSVISYKLSLTVVAIFFGGQECK